MSEHWNLLLTFLSGAFGVGVGYQIIKGAIADHERRLMKIEVKLEAQVGLIQCEKSRLLCSNGIATRLEDLSKQIDKNREVVTDYMKRIENFVGKVEQFMSKE
jgi:hypothetical protein